MEQHKLQEEPPIIKAAVDCLLKDISSIANRIPIPNQISEVTSPPSYSSQNNMADIFRNHDFAQLLCSIAPCIPYYMNSLLLCPNLKIPDSSFEELMKFAVGCLEFTSFLVETDQNDFNVNLVDSFITAADRIFKDNNVCSFFNGGCQHIVAMFFCKQNDKPLPSVPKYSLNNTLENVETMPAGLATYQLYILVCWLFETKSTNVDIPNFFLTPIRSTVISLSRLPLGCGGLDGSRKCRVLFAPKSPPLSIELLQELDVLEEYIFRITLLGWTSRQQFEETWMCLLSVLCSPLDNLDPVEVNDAIHGSSLAIKAITSLLSQTLMCPTAGHPNVSKLLHVSRDLTISDDSISIRKLRKVLDIIKQKYNECSHVFTKSEMINVFDQRNFEKLNNKYSYGQMSIKYFLMATDIVQEDEENSVPAVIVRNRKKTLEECGLDINSCLQFLLDYYTQLMKPQSLTNIRILPDAIRSTVIISDLFTDKSQFSWMLDVFLELSKLHAVEDELLHQYLIVGVCKAVGVLTPDIETFEQVKKLLIQYLKSPYLSSRIASLYGLLYVLEGCKLMEYVQLNLNTNNSVLRQSQEHSVLVWSLAFYLIENVDETNMEHNFVLKTLTAALGLLNSTSVKPLEHSIIRGLQRLLILNKRMILEKVGKQILKLSLDHMKCDNPMAALLGTQLLLTYMYTDCAEHLHNTQTLSGMQSSPDHLVQTIEKISAIFELDILCSVMPTILDDFFSPSDILTKVIGEFLSPQQPHPKLLSKMVFQVFESAIRQEQLSLLQDWVVFSLSSFTQSFSIGMATWCLTCFFISSSSNEWLRSYFPYVQTRVGRYEYEDKKMLCISGADFYKNLPNDQQRQKFIENFNKVKDQPDMPFYDLLSSL
ncbi:hypothetical protein NQ317_016785 [Molorchus minor]|uniref:Huntingtin n=1 Tax=Molorchus minor TaxID=1323400 RepID=A0ABQ9IYA0_9CUCU|nr:hypothetical protein NQ317_016785 [Molorchus minor]